MKATSLEVFLALKGSMEPSKVGKILEWGGWNREATQQEIRSTHCVLRNEIFQSALSPRRLDESKRGKFFLLTARKPIT